MIYLFLANGFEEVEALAPLDLLRRAGKEVTVVGVGGEEICGAHGVTVRADIPDILFRDSCPEAVILPGGMPGTKNLDASPVVEAALRACLRNGGWLCAICAAPSILGKRGMLAGKQAVVYPGNEDSLTGATVSKERVVRDGHFITAKGPGVAVEFGLAIVDALCGGETAGRIRRAFIAD